MLPSFAWFVVLFVYKESTGEIPESVLDNVELNFRQLIEQKLDEENHKPGQKLYITKLLNVTLHHGRVRRPTLHQREL